MMTRPSLPIKRPDGSVLIEPLHPAPYDRRQVTQPRIRRLRGYNNTEVQPDAIFRDIAVLALLAVAIIAGSAVLLGLLWHDVMLAETQVRIIEAEQATKAALAEAAIKAASEGKADPPLLPLILGGAGIAAMLLALAGRR